MEYTKQDFELYDRGIKSVPTIDKIKAEQKQMGTNLYFRNNKKRNMKENKKINATKTSMIKQKKKLRKEKQKQHEIEIQKQQELNEAKRLLKDQNFGKKKSRKVKIQIEEAKNNIRFLEEGTTA